MNRLGSEAPTLATFDAPYFYQNLGRPGHAAIEALKQSHGEDHPALQYRSGYPQAAATDANREAFWQEVVMKPEGLVLPEDVKAMIDQGNSYWMTNRTIITEVDLNNDGVNEYLQVGITPGAPISARYFMARDGRWLSGHLQPEFTMMSDADTFAMLEAERVTLVPRDLQSVRIGGVVYHPQPDSAFNQPPIKVIQRAPP